MPDKATGYFVTICLIVDLGGSLFGVGTAVISGAIDMFKTTFRLDVD